MIQAGKRRISVSYTVAVNIDVNPGHYGNDSELIRSAIEEAVVALPYEYAERLSVMVRPTERPYEPSRADAIHTKTVSKPNKTREPTRRM
jgi:hypothetical protein